MNMAQSEHRQQQKNNLGHILHHLRRIGPPSSDPQTPDIIDLKEVITIFGRNAQSSHCVLTSSDIQQRKIISRRHARIIITRNDNTHKIHDDSYNGVFINDFKIAGSVELQEGDTVTFGHRDGVNLMPGTRARQPRSEYQFIFERCECRSTTSHGHQMTVPPTCSMNASIRSESAFKVPAVPAKSEHSLMNGRLPSCSQDDHLGNSSSDESHRNTSVFDQCPLRELERRESEERSADDGKVQRMDNCNMQRSVHDENMQRLDNQNMQRLSDCIIERSADDQNIQYGNSEALDLSSRESSDQVILTCDDSNNYVNDRDGGTEDPSFKFNTGTEADRAESDDILDDTMSLDLLNTTSELLDDTICESESLKTFELEIEASSAQLTGLNAVTTEMNSAKTEVSAPLDAVNTDITGVNTPFEIKTAANVINTSTTEMNTLTNMNTIVKENTTKVGQQSETKTLQVEPIGLVLPPVDSRAVPEKTDSLQIVDTRATVFEKEITTEVVSTSGDTGVISDSATKVSEIQHTEITEPQTMNDTAIESKTLCGPIFLSDAVVTRGSDSDRAFYGGAVMQTEDSPDTGTDRTNLMDTASVIPDNSDRADETVKVDIPEIESVTQETSRIVSETTDVMNTTLVIPDNSDTADETKKVDIPEIESITQETSRIVSETADAHVQPSKEIKAQGVDYAAAVSDSDNTSNTGSEKINIAAVEQEVSECTDVGKSVKETTLENVTFPSENTGISEIDEEPRKKEASTLETVDSSAAVLRASDTAETADEMDTLTTVSDITRTVSCPIDDAKEVSENMDTANLESVPLDSAVEVSETVDAAVEMLETVNTVQSVSVSTSSAEEVLETMDKSESVSEDTTLVSDTLDTRKRETIPLDTTLVSDTLDTRKRETIPLDTTLVSDTLDTRKRETIPLDTTLVSDTLDTRKRETIPLDTTVVSDTIRSAKILSAEVNTALEIPETVNAQNTLSVPDDGTTVVSETLDTGKTESLPVDTAAAVSITTDLSEAAAVPVDIVTGLETLNTIQSAPVPLDVGDVLSETLEKSKTESIPDDTTAVSETIDSVEAESFRLPLSKMFVVPEVMNKAKYMPVPMETTNIVSETIDSKETEPVPVTAMVVKDMSKSVSHSESKIVVESETKDISFQEADLLESTPVASKTVVSAEKVQFPMDTTVNASDTMDTSNIVPHLVDSTIVILGASDSAKITSVPVEKTVVLLETLILETSYSAKSSSVPVDKTVVQSETLNTANTLLFPDDVAPVVPETMETEKRESVPVDTAVVLSDTDEPSEIVPGPVNTMAPEAETVDTSETVPVPADAAVGVPVMEEESKIELVSVDTVKSLSADTVKLLPETNDLAKTMLFAEEKTSLVSAPVNETIIESETMNIAKSTPFLVDCTTLGPESVDTTKAVSLSVDKTLNVSDLLDTTELSTRPLDATSLLIETSDSAKSASVPANNTDVLSETLNKTNTMLLPDDTKALMQETIDTEKGKADPVRTAEVVSDEKDSSEKVPNTISVESETRNITEAVSVPMDTTVVMSEGLDKSKTDSAPLNIATEVLKTTDLDKTASISEVEMDTVKELPVSVESTVLVSDALDTANSASVEVKVKDFISEVMSTANSVPVGMNSTSIVSEKMDTSKAESFETDTTDTGSEAMDSAIVLKSVDTAKSILCVNKSVVVKEAVDSAEVLTLVHITALVSEETDTTKRESFPVDNTTVLLERKDETKTESVPLDVTAEVLETMGNTVTVDTTCTVVSDTMDTTVTVSDTVDKTKTESVPLDTTAAVSETLDSAESGQVPVKALAVVSESVGAQLTSVPINAADVITETLNVAEFTSIVHSTTSHSSETINTVEMETVPAETATKRMDESKIESVQEAKVPDVVDLETVSDPMDTAVVASDVLGTRETHTIPEDTTDEVVSAAVDIVKAVPDPEDVLANVSETKPAAETVPEDTIAVVSNTSENVSVPVETFTIVSGTTETDSVPPCSVDTASVLSELNATTQTATSFIESKSSGNYTASADLRVDGTEVLIEETDASVCAEKLVSVNTDEYGPKGEVDQVVSVKDSRVTEEIREEICHEQETLSSAGSLRVLPVDSSADVCFDGRRDSKWNDSFRESETEGTDAVEVNIYAPANNSVGETEKEKNVKEETIQACTVIEVEETETRSTIVVKDDTSDCINVSLLDPNTKPGQESTATTTKIEVEEQTTQKSFCDVGKKRQRETEIVETLSEEGPLVKKRLIEDGESAEDEPVEKPPFDVMEIDGEKMAVCGGDLEIQSMQTPEQYLEVDQVQTKDQQMIEAEGTHTEIEERLTVLSYQTDEVRNVRPAMEASGMDTDAHLAQQTHLSGAEAKTDEVTSAIDTETDGITGVTSGAEIDDGTEKLQDAMIMTDGVEANVLPNTYQKNKDVHKLQEKGINLTCSGMKESRGTEEEYVEQENISRRSNIEDRGKLFRVLLHHFFAEYNSQWSIESCRWPVRKFDWRYQYMLDIVVTFFKEKPVHRPSLEDACLSKGRNTYADQRMETEVVQTKVKTSQKINRISYADPPLSGCSDYIGYAHCEVEGILSSVGTARGEAERFESMDIGGCSDVVRTEIIGDSEGSSLVDASESHQHMETDQMADSVDIATAEGNFSGNDWQKIGDGLASDRPVCISFAPKELTENETGPDEDPCTVQCELKEEPNNVIPQRDSGYEYKENGEEAVSDRSLPAAPEVVELPEDESYIVEENNSAAVCEESTGVCQDQNTAVYELREVQMDRISSPESVSSSISVSLFSHIRDPIQIQQQCNDDKQSCQLDQPQQSIEKHGCQYEQPQPNDTDKYSCQLDESQQSIEKHGYRDDQQQTNSDELLCLHDQSKPIDANKHICQQDQSETNDNELGKHDQLRPDNDEDKHKCQADQPQQSDSEHSCQYDQPQPNNDDMYSFRPDQIEITNVHSCQDDQPQNDDNECSCENGQEQLKDDTPAKQQEKSCIDIHKLDFQEQDQTLASLQFTTESQTTSGDLYSLQQQEQPGENYACSVTPSPVCTFVESSVSSCSKSTQNFDTDEECTSMSMDEQSLEHFPDSATASLEIPIRRGSVMSVKEVEKETSEEDCTRSETLEYSLDQDHSKESLESDSCPETKTSEFPVVSNSVLMPNQSEKEMDDSEDHSNMNPSVCSLDSFAEDSQDSSSCLIPESQEFPISTDSILLLRKPYLNKDAEGDRTSMNTLVSTVYSSTDERTQDSLSSPLPEESQEFPFIGGDMFSAKEVNVKVNEDEQHCKMTKDIITDDTSTQKMTRLSGIDATGADFMSSEKKSSEIAIDTTSSDHRDEEDDNSKCTDDNSVVDELRSYVKTLDDLSSERYEIKKTSVSALLKACKEIVSELTSTASDEGTKNFTSQMNGDEDMLKENEAREVAVSDESAHKNSAMLGVDEKDNFMRDKANGEPNEEKKEPLCEMAIEVEGSEDLPSAPDVLKQDINLLTHTTIEEARYLIMLTEVREDSELGESDPVPRVKSAKHLIVECDAPNDFVLSRDESSPLLSKKDSNDYDIRNTNCTEQNKEFHNVIEGIVERSVKDREATVSELSPQIGNTLETNSEEHDVNNLYDVVQRTDSEAFFFDDEYVDPENVAEAQVKESASPEYPLDISCREDVVGSPEFPLMCTESHLEGLQESDDENESNIDSSQPDIFEDTESGIDQLSCSSTNTKQALEMPRVEEYFDDQSDVEASDVDEAEDNTVKKSESKILPYLDDDCQKHCEDDRAYSETVGESCVEDNSSDCAFASNVPETEDHSDDQNEEGISDAGNKRKIEVESEPGHERKRHRFDDCMFDDEEEEDFVAPSFDMSCLELSQVQPSVSGDSDDDDDEMLPSLNSVMGKEASTNGKAKKQAVKKSLDFPGGPIQDKRTSVGRDSPDRLLTASNDNIKHDFGKGPENSSLEETVQEGKGKSGRKGKGKSKKKSSVRDEVSNDDGTFSRDTDTGIKPEFCKKTELKSRDKSNKSLNGRKTNKKSGSDVKTSQEDVLSPRRITKYSHAAEESPSKNTSNSTGRITRSSRKRTNPHDPSVDELSQESEVDHMVEHEQPLCPSTSSGVDTEQFPPSEFDTDGRGSMRGVDSKESSLKRPAPEDDHNQAKLILERIKNKRMKVEPKWEPDDSSYDSPLKNSQESNPDSQHEREEPRLALRSAKNVTTSNADQYKERCCDILDSMEGNLKSNPYLNHSERVQSWKKDLEALKDRTVALPNTVIAVVGATGCGKSSLLNGLLDHVSILPTSGMRACTAVVVEIVENTKNNNYEAVIQFLAREEWESEVNMLLTDLTGQDGRVRARQPADLRSEAGVAWCKIRAVYGKFNDSCTLEQLNHVSQVTRWLGREKRISERRAKDFRKAVNRYIESNDPGKSGGQFWPIVKHVKVYIPNCDVCTGGVTLVDLPGVRDSNAARDKIAKEFLKNCSAVFVVASIHRAKDDRTAKDLLGEQFRRQLFMDGQYGSITFICTKTDSLLPSETKNELQLAECDSVEALGEELENKEQEREDLSAAKKELDRELRKINKKLTELAERIDDCRKDFVELSQAVDPVDTDNEVQDDAAEQLRELQDDLVKKESVEEKLKNEKIAIQQRLSSEEKQILECENQITALRRELTAKCAKARNEYCKKQIKKDFRAGLRDIKRRAGMLDDDEDDDDDDDDYDEGNDEDDQMINDAVNNLKVFTVSSVEYLRMTNKLIDDGPAQVFKTKGETEIPALKSYVHEMASVRQLQRVKQLICGVSRFVKDIESYLTNEGSESGLVQTDLKNAVQLKLKNLHKNLEGLITRVCNQVRTAFDDILCSRTREGAQQAAKLANGTSARWSAKRNLQNPAAGGLHFSTYKAVVNHGGEFNSPTSGHIDFNQQLTDPMYSTITVCWDNVFNSKLLCILKWWQTSVLMFVKQSVQSLKEDLLKLGVVADATDRVNLQLLNSSSTRISDSVSLMTVLITERQREYSRCLTPAVKEHMLQAYNDCASESGKGSYERMKQHMNRNVTISKDVMFMSAYQSLEENLAELKGEIVGHLKEVTENLIKDIYMLYEPFWTAPNSIKALREAYLSGVIQCCRQVKELYREAEIKEDHPLFTAEELSSDFPLVSPELLADDVNIQAQILQLLSPNYASQPQQEQLRDIKPNITNLTVTNLQNAPRSQMCMGMEPNRSINEPGTSASTASGGTVFGRTGISSRSCGRSEKSFMAASGEPSIKREPDLFSELSTSHQNENSLAVSKNNSLNLPCIKREPLSVTWNSNSLTSPFSYGSNLSQFEDQCPRQTTWRAAGLSPVCNQIDVKQENIASNVRSSPRSRLSRRYRSASSPQRSEGVDGKRKRYSEMIVDLTGDSTSDEEMTKCGKK